MLNKTSDIISLKRMQPSMKVIGAAGLALAMGAAWTALQVLADPLPGGTLDPTSIPKYVTPLVIPPVMNKVGKNLSSENDPDANDLSKPEDYKIAERQFKQQILPGGVWNTITGRSDNFPATTVWSYGPETDPTPIVAPDPSSQFNYPAYTIEAKSNKRTNVRWVNDLVDRHGNYLPHLLPVDQTLHWANPPKQCAHGGPGTDCAGSNAGAYTGPVPMVVHLHGSHVDPDSDGYPEAWWLPAAKNIPNSYAMHGRLFDDATGKNPGKLGYADFSYRNDQPATTLWYHDHTLGMTRTNVYAGPAGFWLIRGGQYDGAAEMPSQKKAVLPGPAPQRGQGVLALNTPSDPVRKSIREIPIVIQDRSFNTDGSLFYPSNRAFFEGLLPEQLQIKFQTQSDVPPIWNAEAFFNVMVVNGVSWPKLDVAQAQYRFRLLNGCDSRFLNLALFVVNPDTNDIDPNREVPFYRIGAEQGFLPRVVRTKTGEQIPLTPGAPEPASNPDSNDPTALLLALAERADVIVDFSSLPNGTIVRMINTAPDSPFGGFPADPADPSTTGQVMQFVVNKDLNGAKGSSDGKTAAPANLKLNAEQALPPATATRLVSVNENSSMQVCVPVDADGNNVLDTNGNLVQIPNIPTDATFLDSCAAAGGAPFGPTMGLLGTVSGTGVDAVGNPLQWLDETGLSQPMTVKLNNGTTLAVNATETPKRGDIEEWQIYNYTEDAHPIHIHLVRFQVVHRTLFDGTPSTHGNPQPWETGYKDMVIAYPGEITTVRARFDIAGLYVWHCHIVEHEDNEMMRPLVVSDNPPPHDHDGNHGKKKGHNKKGKHHYRWADKHLIKHKK